MRSAGFAFSKASVLKVDTVDRVNLARHQRVHPRRVVVDRDVFDLFKETSGITFVVISNPRRDHAHTGIKGLTAIKARTDTLGNRLFDLARWVHADVIIRHQIREVGVASGQRELHLMYPIFLHLGDGFNDRLCG